MKKIILFPLLLLAAFAFSAFFPVTNGSVFTMQMSSSKGMTGTVKVYYDTPGTRIEINMVATAGFTIARTSLVKKAEPDVVYQLDPANKTYSTTDVSNAETDRNDEPATATVLGTDSVNGFKCTHAKVVQGKKNWEVWTTASIPEYAQFSAVMNRQRYIGNHGMHEALKAKNAEGFPVKMILTDERGETTTTELKSVTHQPLDASLFAVPADYKKGAAPAGAPGGPYHH